MSIKISSILVAAKADMPIVNRPKKSTIAQRYQVKKSGSYISRGEGRPDKKMTSYMMALTLSLMFWHHQ